MSDNREIYALHLACQLPRFLKIPSFMKLCEDSIRKSVKEGIEKPLTNYLNSANYWNPPVGTTLQTPRDLELRLLEEVPHVIWTGEPIKGQGQCSIQVALFDVQTGIRITFGPEASAQVEIVILEGQFDVNDWTVEEFNQNIIRDKKGKKILKGDVFVKLRDGIASIDSLHIIHHNDWMKVNKLRLGAKCDDIRVGTRVREAKTEPFTVKDKRMIKKIEEPCLMDKVSRLKKIGKVATNSLNARNIITVKDFLIEYNLNPEKLKETLHFSKTKLIEAVNHARKCKVEKNYAYHLPNYDPSVGVVFSEVYDVLGMVHGSNYIPHNRLRDTIKEEAKELAKIASENKNVKLVPWTQPFSLTTIEAGGPSQKNADSLANMQYEMNGYMPNRSRVELEGVAGMYNNYSMGIGGMEFDGRECDESGFMVSSHMMGGDNLVMERGQGKRQREGLLEEVNAVQEDDTLSYRKAVMLKKMKRN